MQNTRAIAVQLRKLADFLDSRPEFEFPFNVHIMGEEALISFYNKEEFLKAAKALGNAKKSYTEGEYGKFVLTADDFPLSIDIQRDAVCNKKITYDCQPMFSTEEVEAL